VGAVEAMTVTLMVEMYQLIDLWHFFILIDQMGANCVTKNKLVSGIVQVLQAAMWGIMTVMDV
jgi:hypothetical protein